MKQFFETFAYISENWCHITVFGFLYAVQTGLETKNPTTLEIPVG